MITKAINIGVLLLAFSTPIKQLLEGRTTDLIRGASLGFIDPAFANQGGAFNKAAALEFYGPMGAALLLKKAISMIRRSARV